ncbi:hypothetical protein [Thalassoroseus pseudoceratinae]|uniref:hypothetical protein n=1 Tax=Thalassoroseus pseudoceratinae TaxID=2713176 RepID=UPI001421BFC1|nr:hypothetical protein [Thalassoroseus pseudoceratinae]
MVAAAFVMPGNRHTHQDGERSHAHNHPHPHVHDHRVHQTDEIVSAGPSHTHFRFLWFEFSLTDPPNRDTAHVGVVDDNIRSNHLTSPAAWMQWLQVLVLLAGLLASRDSFRWSVNSTPQVECDSPTHGRLPERPLLPPPKWI